MLTHDEISTLVKNTMTKQKDRTDRFNAIKVELDTVFENKNPDGYESILAETLKLMYPNQNSHEPNWNKIGIIARDHKIAGRIYVMPSVDSTQWYWTEVPISVINWVTGGVRENTLTDIDIAYYLITRIAPVTFTHAECVTSTSKE